jgi:hypothetical protein
MFSGGTAPAKLTLLDTETSTTGVVILKYGRQREPAQPQ